MRPKMLTLDVVNTKKEKVSSLEVDNEVFTVLPHEELFSEMVNMQLAKKRGGNASTKTRGFVRGGGKKPWRQKGTGRARVGSSRSPLWVGGAVVFGPHPRDYTLKMPKKAKKLVLKSALSLKIKENKLVIFDDIHFTEPKTKEFTKILSNFNISNALIIDGKANVNLEKSVRNIKNIKYLADDGINVYDLLKYEYLITTVTSLKKIEGNLKK